MSASDFKKADSTTFALAEGKYEVTNARGILSFKRNGEVFSDDHLEASGLVLALVHELEKKQDIIDDLSCVVLGLKQPPSPSPARWSAPEFNRAFMNAKTAMEEGNTSSMPSFLKTVNDMLVEKRAVVSTIDGYRGSFGGFLVRCERVTDLPQVLVHNANVLIESGILVKDRS